jgi:hypothetical protein
VFLDCASSLLRAIVGSLLATRRDGLGHRVGDIPTSSPRPPGNARGLAVVEPPFRPSNRQPPCPPLPASSRRERGATRATNYYGFSLALLSLIPGSDLCSLRSRENPRRGPPRPSPTTAAATATHWLGSPRSPTAIETDRLSATSFTLFGSDSWPNGAFR